MQDESTGSSLRMQLLQKGAALLTVWLHSQATLWCFSLPNQLRAAGPPGAHCALFWPPVGTTLITPSGEVPSFLKRFRKHIQRLTLQYSRGALGRSPHRAAAGAGDGVKGGSRFGYKRLADWPSALRLATPIVAAASEHCRCLHLICTMHKPL